MKKTMSLLVIFTCLLISGCSDVYDVSYDYDEQYPISSVRTFDWLPPTKKNQGRMDELTFQRVQTAISTDLQAKGVTQSSTDPDMQIELSFGAKGAQRRSGRRSNYRYKEGHLNVEFVDPQTNGLIWSGSGRAALSYEQTPEDTKKTVEDVVAKILANYPPESGR